MTVAKSWISAVKCAAVLAVLGLTAGAALAQLGGTDAASVSFTILHSFTGPDGNSPQGGMVQATNGTLYGTTFYGGAYSSGSAFRISPGGSLTTLYSFCAQTNCADGKWPSATLVQATNGDLYGTTVEGGGRNSGTIYRITPSGSLTTLYTFCAQANCPDGRYPFAGPVQAANGDLYGTTSQGGLDQSHGTIFKITPRGTFTTIYSFCAQSGCPDGESPNGPLVQAADGGLYGTTGAGIVSCSPNGCVGGSGTFFKITPKGALTTLYSFCTQTGCPDGLAPSGALVQAPNGDLYGTTTSGGANPGITTHGGGTVFKITPTGTLTTLYNFCAQSGCTDGYFPAAGLVQATNGNLYGTTENGGTSGDGTIFEITLGGSLTTVYNFCSQINCADGFFPLAPLVQDTNGSVY
jgi:uncharacterized repeat protein (TIGR03803 family)